MIPSQDPRFDLFRLDDVDRHAVCRMPYAVCLGTPACKSPMIFVCKSVGTTSSASRFSTHSWWHCSSANRFCAPKPSHDCEITRACAFWAMVIVSSVLPLSMTTTSSTHGSTDRIVFAKRSAFIFCNDEARNGQSGHATRILPANSNVY